MSTNRRTAFLRVLSVTLGIISALAIPVSVLHPDASQSADTDSSSVVSQDTSRILAATDTNTSDRTGDEALRTYLVTTETSEVESRNETIVTGVAAEESAPVASPAPIATGETVPESTAFNIIIDKIGLNKAVVPDVDPTDKSIYLPVLEKNVAHGKWTAKPSKNPGNTYLFAHSYANANQAGGWFTRIDELVPGDRIVIHYNGEKLTYKVDSAIVVDPSQTSVYTAYAAVPQITLQTCYPRGSTESRLIITASLTQ